ncbi:MAG: hypothetical protein BRC30_02275 [Nanohaloarchaea archaeon SW_7_46_7]|nr:MAG: hypothetical protein BRC30_02275 [Nanohaloarchaea archaeon SW_7_46_7]
MSASKQKSRITGEKLVESVGDDWRREYSENSKENVGAEKEDIIRNSEGLIENQSRHSKT